MRAVYISESHIPGHAWIFSLPTLMSLLVLAPSVLALTEYQRHQITRYLDSPKMRQEKAIFDGKAFNPKVGLKQATAYYNGYIDSMNRALRGWKMLSSSAAASAEGQALFARLRQKLEWAKAMQAAYAGFRAGKTAQPGAAATPSPPAAASGGMTDYQKQTMTRYLDSKSMQQDASIFDGQAFVAGLPFSTIDRYYNAFIDSLNKATRAWDTQISSSAKGTPDGQRLHQRLVDARAWADAMSARLPDLRRRHAEQQHAQQAARQQAERTAKTRQAAHKQLCADFQRHAMTPLNREPMTRLINQMLSGNAQITSVAGVQKHQKVAREVLAVCQSVDTRALTASACWYVLNRPAYDPAHWCRAAARADALIKAAAMNSARQTVRIIGTATIQSPEQLRKRDGWLTFEGPVTFKEKLYFSAHGREEVMHKVKALLDAAGVENVDQTLWAEQLQRLEALRTAVEQTAGTWKTPPKKADNYSTQLARNQIARMHAGAEIYAAFLSRASYKIHKNALGVPLRRTMPGYVLFKLPEDPYCQLRSYTLTEEYSGGGEYQKAAGVSIGYVRFQICP